MVFESLCASTAGLGEGTSNYDGCGRRFQHRSRDHSNDSFVLGIFIAAARENVG